MSGTLKRKMAPKRWAQVYTDRQDSILQKRLEKEQRDAEERAFILKQREEKRRQEKERAEYEAEVADEVASDSSADSPKGTRPPPKSPTKLRMVIRDCRHTIENLSPPPKQKDWSAHWGTCLACYLCNRPAINDCTVCPKCNLIYHNLCHSYQSGISSRYSSDICPNCDEEHQLDMLHYYEMVDKLRTEKIRSISAEIITRRAHVFLARKNLKWARQMITMIQAIVRGKMARNKYKINRRSFFRVVLMNILQLPQYADVPLKHILLVITINDTYKNIQLFRFDKTAETVFDETILVPGIAAYMTVIFTLGVREEVYTYNLVGQAQLSVRDMVNAAHRKEYVLNFMDNILVSIRNILYAYYSICVPYVAYYDGCVHRHDVYQ
ncbi:hypothetical protein EON63_04205 [archaeon]|nr:MAG: hypothetical protein EON63_04205 [archaeon]